MDDNFYERFPSDEQRKLYNDVSEYFQKLIEIEKEGAMFFIDGEIWPKPFIDGFEIGFRDGNLTLLFVGCTHDLNEETQEYDVPYIDIDVEYLKERITVLKKLEI